MDRRKEQKRWKHTVSSSYLRESDLDNISPIINNDISESNLAQVGEWARGLGLRHWKSLRQKMYKAKYDTNFIKAIKVSFFKFKLMTNLDPKNKQNLIWIFKNFLPLERQKLFLEVRDQYLDTSIWIVRTLRCKGDYRVNPLVWRLLDYFESTDMTGLQLPLKTFPTIFFSKKRMFLSMVQDLDHNEKEFREKVTAYISRLEMKDLFVPPPDILHKIGNSKYNDDGEIKKDFDRPSNYDSGFLYQEFMAQPLQPREVWLPGKKIKDNNIFWMIIGRQFLSQDNVYPKSDRSNLDHLLTLKDFSRFDISGFGFQYSRKLLRIIAEVITELYPCSPLQEKLDEFSEILQNVRVDVGSEVIRPPRGIGLGYYEDLKTIGVLAILYQYHPYSVYGDQGLLPGDTTWDAIIELMRWGFIFSSDDKITAFSSTSTSLPTIKWAGYKYDCINQTIHKPNELADPLMGSFFQPYHWRRKSSLLSYCLDNKKYYKSIEKRIIRLYNLYYGNEFQEGDNETSFFDVGISIKASPLLGEHRYYLVCEKRVPFENCLFSPTYVTPFKRVESKVYPKGLAKQFSKKRREIFNKTPSMDSGIHFYINPRYKYNGIFKPPARLLPEWADLLYMFHYGCSSGSFTYNLLPWQMDKAIIEYGLCSDPLKAYASGGIQIYDANHRVSLPASEWVEAVEGLKRMSARHLDYIQFAALPVNRSWHDDSFYREEDLTEKHEDKRQKMLDSQLQFHSENFQDEIRLKATNALISTISRGGLQNALDFVQFEGSLEQSLDQLNNEFILGEDESFLLEEVDFDNVEDGEDTLQQDLEW